MHSETSSQCSSSGSIRVSPMSYFFVCVCVRAAFMTRWSLSTSLGAPRHHTVAIFDATGDKRMYERRCMNNFKHKSLRYGAPTVVGVSEVVRFRSITVLFGLFVMLLALTTGRVRALELEFPHLPASPGARTQFRVVLIRVHCSTLLFY